MLSNRPVSDVIQVSLIMIIRTMRRVRMLNDLRGKITSMYPAFSRWSYFEDCCFINKAHLVYSKQYKAFVSIQLDRHENVRRYRLFRRSYRHAYMQADKQ